jgi:hypothetical protein
VKTASISSIVSIRPALLAAIVILATGSLLVSSLPALADFVQQGEKLVGTGAVGNAQQGQSVAVSSDGNTAIMGGPNDSGNTGAAWVFTRSGGGWTQQGNKLVGSDGVGSAEQGKSVALSADGNTAIVGGDRDHGQKGAAWVYTRSGGVWTQQGAKLIGDDYNFGMSVALSADGNTAIVGGIGSSGNGAAWVFTRGTAQGNGRGPLAGLCVRFPRHKGRPRTHESIHANQGRQATAQHREPC